VARFNSATAFESVYDAVNMACGTLCFGTRSCNEDRDCSVVVNGGPRTAKVSTLTVDEIETVEVHYRGGGPGTICSYLLLAVVGVGAIGCARPVPPHCGVAQSKEPSISRSHHEGVGPSRDSARLVVDLQSADDRTGHLRQALVQLHIVSAATPTYTMVEDTLVAGRYTHRLLTPGVYVVRVRIPGYAMIADTISLHQGAIDSAVYHTQFAGFCLE
jgi:hypothetical protein